MRTSDRIRGRSGEEIVGILEMTTIENVIRDIVVVVVIVVMTVDVVFVIVDAIVVVVVNVFHVIFAVSV